MYNIKVDHKQLSFVVEDLPLLAQDRNWWDVSSECGNEPLGSIKGGKFIDREGLCSMMQSTHSTGWPHPNYEIN
jgi:hypothetical protein